MVQLTLLTRPGCHLCEELKAALAAEFAGSYRLTERCVDETPEWRRRFGTVIPVLLNATGDVVCQTRFDRTRVAAALGGRSG